MEEVLVDGSEFVLEDEVQKFDGLCVGYSAA
jgi:hypothetical protein